MNCLTDTKAFKKLKPLCLQFINNNCVENIDKIEKLVVEMDPGDIEKLLQYISVPFRVHLTNPSPERVTIRCIDFLTILFRNITLKHWSIFDESFKLMVTKLVVPGKNPGVIIEGQEELKISICEFISSLVSCSTQEVLNEMYSLTFRTHFGHAVYLLNQMLIQEKSKPLRRAILSTLGALTYSEKFVGEKFKMTEEVASKALASCFPGICTVLHRAACGDNKQGHGIFVLALEVFADFLVLVVGDESYERDVTDDKSDKAYFAYKSSEKDFKLDDEHIKSLVIIKSESWFKNMAEKLVMLISQMTYLAGHENWKVRRAFLKLSEFLLLKCTKTLEICIPKVLPAVFALSVDENEAIASYCGNLLITFSERFQNMNSASLNSILENNIEKLTLQLMAGKISASDNKKLSTLKSLLGYIEVLGSSVSSFLFSPVMIENILKSLVVLLDFDTTVLNLVEELPFINNLDSLSEPWAQKRFKFFENEDILNTICKICYSLGHIHGPRLIINYLIEELEKTESCILQRIFLVGTIIEGCSRESNSEEKYSNLVNEVIEFFLSSSLFDPSIHDKDNLPLKRETEMPPSSLASVNSTFNKNKLQICLILEVLAKCSICLGTEFKVHLRYTLCPVMEKAGSPQYVISQCGRLCLYFFTLACGYKSVSKLIKDNSDYVTNILMINFHQYFRKPETAVVICVVMEQCDSEALVLFRDLIFQVLNVLDYNQKNAYFFMLVLFSVVASIKKWFPSKKDNSHFNAKLKNPPKSLRARIADYIALKKKSLGHIDDDDLNCQDFPSTQNSDDYDTNKEEKQQIPLHINVACEVFKRCVHLQSSENMYLRMLVLETVEVCIIVLKDYENELHPLIHEFWSPFLRRFTEETFTSKAFHILLAIANQCGDFIRQRTFKDVMPKLLNFLKNECSKSQLKGNFRHYQWSNDHALQVLMLSEIGHLCTKLDVDDKDINAVANVCLPYLEKDQPKVLQDAAIKSLKALATIDSDAVWFYWNVLYSKNKIIPAPHDYLSDIYFPFSDNSLTNISIEF